MNQPTAQNAPESTIVLGAAYPAALRRWLKTGRFRPARGGSEGAGAHGTLWLEYGAPAGYTLNDARADADLDRAVYAQTAYVVWVVMFDVGVGVRNGTHYRIAASVLDELWLASMPCTGCEGNSECERCGGSGYEPASSWWRASRCGINLPDYVRRTAAVYRRAYATVVASLREPGNNLSA